MQNIFTDITSISYTYDISDIISISISQISAPSPRCEWPITRSSPTPPPGSDSHPFARYCEATINISPTNHQSSNNQLSKSCRIPLPGALEQPSIYHQLIIKQSINNHQAINHQTINQQAINHQGIVKQPCLGAGSSSGACATGMFKTDQIPQPPSANKFVF